MKKQKRTYCRVCGENKGHNSDRCTNASGLRNILKEQDQQLRSATEELRRLKEQQPKIESLKTQSEFLWRVATELCHALALEREAKSK